jgi:molybdate transport system regulatory protein
MCYKGSSLRKSPEAFDMGVKIQLWLEKDGELILGSGRRDLLRLIRDLGSLNRAAKELGMSYRAAWGKIRDTERSLGWKLVQVQGPRKRMTLTPEAEALLLRYQTFEDETVAFVQKLYQQHFSGGI